MFVIHGYDGVIPLFHDVIKSDKFMRKDEMSTDPKHVQIGYGPFPVTVTTRIITSLVGNPL